MWWVVSYEFWVWGCVKLKTPTQSPPLTTLLITHPCRFPISMRRPLVTLAVLLACNAPEPAAVDLNYHNKPMRAAMIGEMR